MKKFFTVVLILAMILAGCTSEKSSKKNSDATDPSLSKPTITVRDAQTKLMNLSAGLEVRVDDMKEVTFYHCPIDINLHPSIWIIPYVVVDKNFHATLYQNILYVGNEPLYFKKLYIKTSSGVDIFQYKKIVKSSAGEEYVSVMNYELYKKLQSAASEGYAKFRLEGRTFGERELTQEELLNFQKVFSIYEFLESVKVE